MSYSQVEKCQKHFVQLFKCQSFNVEYKGYHKITENIRFPFLFPSPQNDVYSLHLWFFTELPWRSVSGFFGFHSKNIYVTSLAKFPQLFLYLFSNSVRFLHLLLEEIIQLVYYTVMWCPMLNFHHQKFQHHTQVYTHRLACGARRTPIQQRYGEKPIEENNLYSVLNMKWATVVGSRKEMLGFVRPLLECFSNGFIILLTANPCIIATQKNRDMLEKNGYCKF